MMIGLDELSGLSSAMASWPPHPHACRARAANCTGPPSRWRGAEQIDCVGPASEIPIRGTPHQFIAMAGQPGRPIHLAVPMAMHAGVNGKRNAFPVLERPSLIGAGSMRLKTGKCCACSRARSETETTTVGGGTLHMDVVIKAG